MLQLYKEVERELRGKQACIPDGLLQKAITEMTTSSEAFLVVRSHLGRSLATLSIAQWILGVGDRHLSNFMVDLARY